MSKSTALFESLKKVFEGYSAEEKAAQAKKVTELLINKILRLTLSFNLMLKVEMTFLLLS